MKKKIFLSALFFWLYVSLAWASPVMWGSSRPNQGDRWTSDHRPAAWSRTFVVPHNQPTSKIFSAEDQDDDPLTFSLLATPTQGVVTMTDATTGSWFYTPNPEASGEDNFTFTVSDMAEVSPAASIIVFLEETGALTPRAVLSVPGGHYAAPQTVTLSCADVSRCSAIYYTLDGSTPTTSSTQYGQPLVIAENTTLNYFAWHAEGSTHTVQTALYVFGASGTAIVMTEPNQSVVNALSSIRGTASAAAGVHAVFVRIMDTDQTFYMDKIGQEWWKIDRSPSSGEDVGWLATIDLRQDGSWQNWGVNTSSMPWEKDRTYQVEVKAEDQNGHVSTFLTSFTYTDNPVVTGRITDQNDQPLAGVTLIFTHQDGTSTTAISNDVGYYTKDLNGQWMGVVHAEKPGYEFSTEQGAETYDLNMVGKSVLQRHFSATAALNEKDARVIIVAGGDLEDSLWAATNANANLAYRTLMARGIKKNHIHYFSHDQAQDVDGDGVGGNDVEGLPSLSNLENLLQSLRVGQEVDATRPLYIYLIDHGDPQKMYLTKPKDSPAEFLKAPQLDAWLDTLQGETGAKVVMIYDACYAGSFLPHLKATERQSRIMIASTGSNHLAVFPVPDGTYSFSSTFWNSVFSGNSVRQSFLDARRATLSDQQLAEMDDNGDGLWDKDDDGALAGGTWLGNTSLYASVLPEIVATSGNVFMELGGQTTVWVKTQQAPEDIDRVIAVIMPPGMDENDGVIAPIINLPTLSLEYNDAEQRFEANFEGAETAFSATGRYTISFSATAKHADHLRSIPVTIFVQQGPDAFEPDDQRGNARVIAVDDLVPQWHTIHAFGDEDWVRFVAVSGERYDIQVKLFGDGLDPVLELYDADGTRVEGLSGDEGREDSGEVLRWTAPADGIHFVRVKSFGDNQYGEAAGYELRVRRPDAGAMGFVVGQVVGDNQTPLGMVQLHTNGQGRAFTSHKGAYVIAQSAGPYTLTATMEGYEPFSEEIIVPELGSTVLNISMTPSGKTIHGRVTNSHGAGLPWVWVDVHDRKHTQFFGANTDAQGYYRVHVTPGKYVAVVWGEEGLYQPNWYNQKSDQRFASTIDVTQSDGADVDFRMLSGTSLSGTITGGTSGTVFVSAWSERTHGWGGKEVRLESDGLTEFILGGLPEARDYRLDWHSEDFTSGYYSTTTEGPVGRREATLLNTASGNVADIAISLKSGRSLTVTLTGLQEGDKTEGEIWSEALSRGGWAEAEAGAEGVATMIIQELDVSGSDYRLFVRAANGKYHAGAYQGTPIATTDSDLSDGDDSVAGVDAGQVVGRGQATRIAMTENLSVKVAMNAGGTIAGTVFGLASGQKVWVEAFSKRTHGWGGVAIEADTAGHANYLLTGLKRARDYRIGISGEGIHGGFYPGTDSTTLARWEDAARVDIKTVPTGQENGNATGIDLTVGSSVSISGFVQGLDDTGGLQSGAWAFVDAWSDSTFSWAGTTVEADAEVSGARVSYTLDGLAAASDYEVTLTSPVYETKRTEGIDASNGAEDVDFTVSIGSRLSGTLANLAPYATVWIEAWSPQTGTRRGTGVTANASGGATYVIEGLSYGSDYVVTLSDGSKTFFYQSSGVTPQWEEHTGVSVMGGTTEGIDFDLVSTQDTFFTLSGTLSGLSDEAQIVEVACWSEKGRSKTSRAGNGVFTLDGLLAGNYAVAFYAEGYTPQHTQAVTVDNGAVQSITWSLSGHDVGTVSVTQDTTGLDVSLSDGYSIEGHVTDGTNGIAGVWVEVDGLWVRDEETNTRIRVDGGDDTDANGRFKIEGLPSGSYTLSVWTPNGTASIEVNDVSGDVTDQTLTIQQQTGGVSGTIKTFTGVARSDVLVLVYDADNNQVAATATDDLGKFMVKGLSSGVHTIKAFGSDDFSVEKLFVEQPGVSVEGAVVEVGELGLSAGE